VDDLIDGLIALMQSADEVVGPINIGNPGEYTILEVAEMVLKLTGGRSKIIFKPLPQDDPTQRQPDITLAKHTLGWEPRVPLQEGLERTVAYFRTLLHTDNRA
jgi:UDP-glucuronate decarboxylase